MARDATAQAAPPESPGARPGQQPELPPDRRGFWGILEATLATIARTGGIATIEFPDRDHEDVPRGDEDVPPGNQRPS